MLKRRPATPSPPVSPRRGPGSAPASTAGSPAARRPGRAPALAAVAFAAAALALTAASLLALGARGLRDLRGGVGAAAPLRPGAFRGRFREPRAPGAAGFVILNAQDHGPAAPGATGAECGGSVVVQEAVCAGLERRGRPIVFWHIQKAAGSSMCLMALENGERVRTDAAHPAYGRGCAEGLTPAEEEAREAGPCHYDCRPEHDQLRAFQFGTHRAQEEALEQLFARDDPLTFVAPEYLMSRQGYAPRRDVYTVTALRDPKSRLLSTYYYQQVHEPHHLGILLGQKTTALLDFLEYLQETQQDQVRRREEGTRAGVIEELTMPIPFTST